MPLNRAAGNMYNWVTHTHSYLFGRRKANLARIMVPRT